MSTEKTKTLLFKLTDFLRDELCELADLLTSKLAEEHERIVNLSDKELEEIGSDGTYRTGLEHGFVHSIGIVSGCLIKFKAKYYGR